MRREYRILGDTRTYVPLVKHAGNNVGLFGLIAIVPECRRERTERQRPRNTSRDSVIDLQEYVIAYITSPSLNRT